ncbi:MAG: hypothetical protein WEE50_00245 [Chloroflexota bacterium]
MPASKPSNPLTRASRLRILRARTPSGALSTSRSIGFLDLDVAGVADAYERRLREACPAQLPLAMRLLERLPTGRWTLEWYLPWWLGQAVGLGATRAQEIVLSNVLGLGFVRLQDDLSDGEVGADDIDDARTLAAAMYELALEPYRTWFDPESPFWRHLDARMAAWRSASDLAARGAPLHISAVAVYLLGGRMGAYPALETCLDHALEALVLYDHVADWESDLDAGRWNAFVAASSPGPQVVEARDRHRTATYVAMLTGDAVADYFGRIDDVLLRATAIADTLRPPVPPLPEHLRAFAASVRDQGAAIDARYRDLGDEAAKLLFQETADARS